MPNSNNHISQRLTFAITVVITSFAATMAAMGLDVPELVAQQVVESAGWAVTATATGYLTTKAVEHGVKRFGNNNE